MTPAGLESADRAPPRRGCCDFAVLGLLLLGGALNVWYLVDDCPLDLSGDEAHYWEWGRLGRLDYSYYSKGPLIAYVIAAGRLLFAEWSRVLVGSEMLAVRLPAVLLSLITGSGVYVLAVRTLRDRRLALAAVALLFTMPIITVGSKLTTIDAPLSACWIWTLVLVERGLRGRSPWPWLAAGVLIAVGILAKYNMLFIFPAVLLLCAVQPELRSQFRRPGPYLASTIAACGLLPIVIWNARHGWVSFRHVAGQAGVSGAPSINLAGPFEYVAGQAAVVNVFWLIGIVWACLTYWRGDALQRRSGARSWSLRYLVVMTLTPWLVFLAFSPITKVQPNWPVVALLPGAILLAAWLAARQRLPTLGGRRAARGFVAVGVAFGLACVILMHNTQWLMPVFARLTANAPPWELTPAAKFDPTARLRGWSQLGQAVGEVLQDEALAQRNPFILTDDYQVASQVAFYCPGNPVTYSAASALGARRSQYDIWPNPLRDRADFVGRPVVFIGSLTPALTGEQGGAPIFREVRLARTVEHRVGGQRLQVWSIFVADAFLGFPDTAATSDRY